MDKMLVWIILLVVGCCAEYQDSDGFLKVFLFFFDRVITLINQLRWKETSTIVISTKIIFQMLSNDNYCANCFAK